MLAVALVGFAILLGRVALLQTAEAASFREAGERQRVRSTTLPAARGAIFDRNGYELAISIPQTTIWADPRLIINGVKRPPSHFNSPIAVSHRWREVDHPDRSGTQYRELLDEIDDERLPAHGTTPGAP